MSNSLNSIVKNVMVEMDDGQRISLPLTGNPGVLILDQATNLPKFRKDYIGTAAPTVNDDVDLGYQVGSQWIDTDAGAGSRVFVCIDATDGAAVWQAVG